MYSKKNFTIYWNSKLSKKNFALRNYLYKLYKIRLVILFYITQ